MECLATPPNVSAKAFESLARLQQLTLEAGLSESGKQLFFRILNRSIICCRYDRAVLWSLSGGRTKMLGVSGSCEVDPRSPVVTEWRSLIKAMPNRDQTAIVERDLFDDHKEIWDALAGRTNGLSVVWLPIKVGGQTVAGVWMERWGGSWFSDSELPQLETMALAYGVAWRGVVRRTNYLAAHLLSHKGMVAISVVGLLIAAACFIKMPLRIVAHCEVVPNNPIAITAPLNGVIDEVLVLPGREVEIGDVLAVYDKRVAIEEMKVVTEQVQIIKSDLQRARVQAFDDPAARGAIALLVNRLEQERIRLQIAQYRLNQLEVLAPARGTLMFDDPHEWRGKPVQVGQRILMIVDPAETKLRIWLPDSDNIDFDSEKPLTVFLDSDPRSSRRARLQFVASHSQTDRDGKPSFLAEADWMQPGEILKMGLQGAAVLYGEEVPLGYWLLRRPLGAVRKCLGI